MGSWVTRQVFAELLVSVIKIEFDDEGSVLMARKRDIIAKNREKSLTDNVEWPSMCRSKLN